MNTWFVYFLKKSVAERFGRFVISVSAVALTVTIVTALVTISFGVREKIGAELKQYGANMIVTESTGIDMAMATAEGVKAVSQYIHDAFFQVYGSVEAKGLSIEIIGMDPSRMSGYRVTGRIPSANNELMVGVNLRDILSISEGRRLHFSGDKDYVVTGFFERGSEEDSAALMSIEAAQRLLGTSGVSAVLLNVDTRHMEEIESAISAHFPNLRVKTVRQVAVAEERILGRIELLMLIVSLVVLFSSAIALGSTMAATVIERMEEIGLMRALGATQKDILKFFLAEAGMAGLSGSILGYIVGTISAAAVSLTAFGSFIPPSLIFLPIGIVLGLALAFLSALFPVRDALKIRPAVILRGE